MSDRSADITERTRAEEALRERIKELRCLYSIADVIEKARSLDETLQKVADLLPAGWYYPEAACARLTIGEEEFATANFRATAWKQSADITIKGERIGLVEVRYLEEMPSRFEGPFLEEERELIDAIAERIAMVVERMRAEEALRRSEERFRSLLENTSDWVWEVDERLVYTYASPRVRDLLGYEPGEVLGKTPQELMPEEEARRLAPLLSATVAEHKPFRALENKNLRRDGREVTLETSGIPFFGPDGRFRGYRGIDRDITERKRIASVLAQSETKYRTLIEQSLEGIGLSRGGEVIFANRALLDIFGYEDLEEFRRVPLLDHVAPASRETVRAHFRQGLTDPKARRFEYQVLRKDGEERDLEVSFRQVVIDDQVLTQSTFRDLTERKRAEQALAASEQETARLYAGIPGIAFLLRVEPDSGYRFVAVSRMFVATTGLPRDQIVGRMVHEVIPPASRALVLAKYAEAIRTKATVHWEEVSPYPTGTLHGKVSVAPVLTASGACTHLAGIVHDMTELKRAEEELAASRDYLGSVLNTVAHPVFVKDTRHSWVLLNDAYCSLLGHSREELIGRSDFDFFPKEQAEVFWATDDAVLRAGQAVSNEELFTERTGRVRTILTKKTLYTSPRGEKFVVGVITDVTERKQAEDAMRRSEAVLAKAGEMASLGAWWIDYSNLDDLNANPLHWSPEVFRIFGYRPGEVEVSIAFFFQRVHPDDRSRVEETVASALAARKPYSLEHRIIRADGTERVVWELAEGIFDEAGRPRRLSGAVQDVTDRKQAEDALRDADRRKNEFLGVLSHELRNPLTPIRNSLYILDRATPGGEQARRAHAVIDRQVDHLTRLVDDLLDVTRIGRGKVRLQHTRMDLVEAVRRTIEDHRTLLEDREFIVSLPDDAVWMDGDPARLVQVVGNLLNNAAKFTPVGGRVSVSLTRAGDRAVLEVADTGVGIAPETLKKLFEPFAQEDRSLDRSRGGLGLGLALVKGMVELHGGEVSAHSDGPGKGARFTIKLPVDVDGAVTHADRPPRKAASSGRTILVIEDNRDAADSLAEALELSGHRVTVAYDGETGLAKARDLRPEVVLCDIGLPQMNGYAVARAFRADEALKSAFLVALTGYALPEDLQSAQEAGFQRHLAKPPSVEKLEALLAEVPRHSTGSTEADSTPSPNLVH